ncbi:hypothetical protein GDO81_007017, partial [Engystomops pustulosus]
MQAIPLLSVASVTSSTGNSKGVRRQVSNLSEEETSDRTEKPAESQGDQDPGIVGSPKAAKSDMDMAYERARVSLTPDDFPPSPVMNKPILKKSVTVTETPSAVYHYTAEDLLIPEFSVNRHLNAVFEAAKKDLSTLMKLE